MAKSGIKLIIVLKLINVCSEVSMHVHCRYTSYIKDDLDTY